MPQKNKNKKESDNWLLPIEEVESTTFQTINGAHPAMIDDEALLKGVVFDFGRTGGPGGQHRNRKATACTATHSATSVSGTASERRRQSENRKLSISRLRKKLAIQLRRNIDLKKYIMSELWEERRNGQQLLINPKHRDYPHILAETLDVLHACNLDLSRAAEILQISSTQLLKILSHEKAALTLINHSRKEQGLHPLKA
tara:strand:+ start:285 stop:884 length:600 start_codon:yes stop_codon:yes gene_type:complete